jgi:hypothetical protein
MPRTLGKEKRMSRKEGCQGREDAKGKISRKGGRRKNLYKEEEGGGGGFASEKRETRKAPGIENKRREVDHESEDVTYPSDKGNIGRPAASSRDPPTRWSCRCSWPQLCPF